MWWAVAAQEGAKRGGSYLESRLQEDTYRANAEIAKQRAAAQGSAIDAERENLQRDQRKIKSTQRMSVASRGGLMGGTDLLTLADQARDMQLDNLELVRQRDTALIEGENVAAMENWKADTTKWTRPFKVMAGS